MNSLDDPYGPDKRNADRSEGLSDSSAPEPAAFFEPVEEQDTIRIPADILRAHNIHLLRVKGNSLIRDDLFDGDHVILEKRNTAMEGELVAAVTRNGEAAVKRFYCREGRILLESASPSQEAMVYDEEDVKILGAVVGILRRYTG
jgi:repressor LexA